MAPDNSKVQAVRNWPRPNDVTAMKQFLGLASYYRRYILNFADIARPLHMLMQKDNMYVWSNACDHAFQTLKNKLTEAPILVHPKFDKQASTIILQTDASAIECNYSVIQRECLAIVWGTKQFQHYLLGRSFELWTDHEPLKWLAGQKMEGILYRWAVALQEYDFIIVYRKGTLNNNADALSRQRELTLVSTAITGTQTKVAMVEIRREQRKNEVTQRLLEALETSRQCPKGQLWRRYAQLWSQLVIVEGILCRKYAPGPTTQTIIVPILPKSLKQKALLQCHHSPGAGHQGFKKTLERLRCEAFWVNMAQDVEQHCRECQKCQSSKPPMPSRAPLTNLPIGRPWQMVAIDIVQVPVSINNNKYLLVIQDYFTKWADAIPLQNQRAVTISSEMVKVFCTYGIPNIVHSDQGQNFESTVFHQTLKAFGVEKSRTTAYHPEGDGMVERFNHSLLKLLRTYVEKEEDWEKHLPLALYAYEMAVHSSTGVSPFMLMYGRESSSGVLMQPTGYDASDFSRVLQSKLSQLQDLVEADNTEAAHRQKLCYDRRSMEITDGVRTKIVHVNRLQQRVVPNSIKVEEHRNHTKTGKHLKSTILKHQATQFHYLYIVRIKMWPKIFQTTPRVLPVQPEHVEIPQGNGLVMPAMFSCIRPCCACGKAVSVDRSIAISKAPKVLLIHLNRFHQDVTGKRHKIETFVDFPIELDISEHCQSGDSSQPSSVYDLFAVIHHFGTISSGHSEMDPIEMDPTEMDPTEMNTTEMNTTEMDPTEMNPTEMGPSQMKR
eukprot:Em0005g190a